MEIKAIQIDLARQKENLPFIFSYMDFAKKYEYNTVVLYLENAVRTEDTCFFNEEETYSIAEIKKIVAYAQSQGLDIIPAFETLGHLEKFFEYEQLRPLSEQGAIEKGRGLHGKIDTCGCISNPAFYAFIDKYVSDVSALFPGKYLHVGLDETFDFLVCEDCQTRLRKEETAKGLFFGHVMHMYGLCQKLGKRMMMWDDFFEYFDVIDRLPRDIVMCNWNYGFVGDEPSGHWTNRIKKNWFALYDTLGFDYIFCVYSHRASATCAMDSFTDYAKRYNPIGALMTAWERSDSFYQGAYPCIAYAGKLWAGKATPKDRAKIYAQVLDGNTECAEFLASLNIVDSYGFGDITKICECDYLVKRIYRDTLAYALPKLKGYKNEASGQAKDILTDIYDYGLQQYLELLMQRVGIDYFDGKERAELLALVKEVQGGFDEIKENGEQLWAKYRQGIRSCKDRFHKKFESKQALLEKICAQIKSREIFGALYLDLMLPEGFPTVRSRVEVEYENGEIERVYDGQMKPSISAFDVGGCYHYRLAIKPVKIRRLIFSVYGEGAMYPTHFRYVLDGKVYVAKTVEKICGNVVNEEKVLRNDTRFAQIGHDDGIAHMENLSLSKEIHSIAITFDALK